MFFFSTFLLGSVFRFLGCIMYLTQCHMRSTFLGLLNNCFHCSITEHFLGFTPIAFDVLLLHTNGYKSWFSYIQITLQAKGKAALFGLKVSQYFVRSTQELPFFRKVHLVLTWCSHPFTAAEQQPLADKDPKFQESLKHVLTLLSPSQLFWSDSWKSLLVPNQFPLILSTLPFPVNRY